MGTSGREMEQQEQQQQQQTTVGTNAEESAISSVRHYQMTRSPPVADGHHQQTRGF